MKGFKSSAWDGFRPSRNAESVSRPVRLEGREPLGQQIPQGVTVEPPIAKAVKAAEGVMKNYDEVVAIFGKEVADLMVDQATEFVDRAMTELKG